MKSELPMRQVVW